MALTHIPLAVDGQASRREGGTGLHPDIPGDPGTAVTDIRFHPAGGLVTEDEETREHKRAVLLLHIRKIHYLRRLKRPVYLWWC